MDVLNYIWLNNKQHYDAEKFFSESPIPREYLSHAAETAGKNPEVKFYVWVDFDEINPQKIRFDEDRYPKPYNLFFKNLKDVKAYNENPYLADSSASFWKKIDLLRLYVVQHVLSNEKVSTAYYSDFDMNIPRLSSSLVQTPLKNVGFVFCYDFDLAGLFFENGFLGIDGLNDRSLRWLKTFISSAIKSYDKYPNGWNVYCKIAQSICRSKKYEAVVDLEKYGFLASTLWGAGSIGGRVSFKDITAQEVKRPSFPQSAAYNNAVGVISP